MSKFLVTVIAVTYSFTQSSLQCDEAVIHTKVKSLRGKQRK